MYWLVSFVRVPVALLFENNTAYKSGMHDWNDFAKLLTYQSNKRLLSHVVGTNGKLQNGKMVYLSLPAYALFVMNHVFLLWFEGISASFF